MTTSMAIILAVLAMVIFLGVLSFVMLKILRQETKANQEQFLQLAKQQFIAEQNKSSTELETRKQAIDSAVKGLKDELERYRQLIHEFEKDRDMKYGNLENQLKNASLATGQLQETTSRLSNILGNVKLRGQWGERMAEDIIRYAGLIEGVNYIKQKKLSHANTKPDYTFLLPDKHTINMDVKFPLDNYIQMVNAGTESEKERFEKDFFQNVKGRIKELQNRDYINPSGNTLDFVMLFIPNEQVFGYVQEKMPGFVDLALEQKVILCSPFTLYAMLTIIRQAHENFRYEKDIKKIILLIEQFVKIYEKFKKRFEDMGVLIEKLDAQFRDVNLKSFKNLDIKIRHIEDYKKGKKDLLEVNEDYIEVENKDENSTEGIS